MKDFISQILNIRHMLASPFPAIACVDLGYPEYEVDQFSFPSPVRWVVKLWASIF